MSWHTKGPWSVVEHDHGTVVVTESPKKTKYGASRYAAIGGFDSSDPEQLAEAKANARLIAAAPEMYEALRDVFALRDVSEYLDAIPESAAGGDDEAVSLARKCRAALAKAEGK